MESPYTTLIALSLACLFLACQPDKPMAPNDRMEPLEKPNDPSERVPSPTVDSVDVLVPPPSLEPIPPSSSARQFLVFEHRTLPKEWTLEGRNNLVAYPDAMASLDIPTSDAMRWKRAKELLERATYGAARNERERFFLAGKPVIGPYSSST